MDEVVNVELSEVNRRGFVSGIVAAAGAAFGAPLGGDAGAASARPFKVCVFSDIHFDDFWTNSDDTSFLDGIMARADGRVRIDGSEADWLFGVTARDAGFPECDADGRETHPKILSADFRLFA